jgi:hypothetical protein
MRIPSITLMRTGAKMSEPPSDDLINVLLAMTNSRTAMRKSHVLMVLEPRTALIGDVTSWIIGI